VVDRHGVIGDYELNLRVFSRRDFADCFQPHCGVHLAQLLHFQHEIELTQLRILGLYPIKAFWGSRFLRVQVLEEFLKGVMNFRQISVNNSPQRGSPTGVDLAKQESLNIIVHRAPKGRGIEILRPKTVPRGVPLKG
jgi:hypothetical protein